MLSLRAEPDPDRSLGHARILLEGLAPPAEPLFCIRREGYPTPNLGPRGWQVREERLRPLHVGREGDATVLVVGPAVTRHLEPGPYLFAMPEAGLEGPLFWPDTIDVFDEGEPLPEPDAPAPMPPPAASLTVPPAPTAPAAPADARPAASASASSAMPLPPAPPGRQEPERPPMQGEARPTRLPLLLGLALLLLSAGGAAWWFLAGEGGEPQVARTEAPASPPPQPAPPQAALPPPAWPEGTDGLTLRELVDRAPDAAAIHAAALRRQAAGRHDDALTLFEEAGDRGHAPALTAVARLYDPNGFVPDRPFRNPDPRTAARYYRDAAQRGDAAVAAPRAALHAWLEEQARAGNTSATSALREFWP